jgi:drug/metabolite transporter (DMT)-like permease
MTLTQTDPTQQAPTANRTDAPITGLSLLAAGVTLLLWASAFAEISVALQGGYSPYSVALLRYLTASVLLAVYMLIRRTPLPDWRDLPGLAVVGFFGFTLYNIALNAGQQRVLPGVASFLIASAPVYIALLALLFSRERLTIIGWGGIALSFAGVGVISLVGEEGVGLNVYALLVLLAALAGAAYAITLRRYLDKYGVLRTTTYAIWMGTALMLVFLPGLLRQMQTATTSGTVAVIYLGIFPGAVGYMCWSYVLSKIPASIAGSFLYMIPLLATFIAWLRLGEVPGAPSFVGGVLIIAGVIAVNRFGRVKPVA